MKSPFWIFVLVSVGVGVLGLAAIAAIVIRQGGGTDWIDPADAKLVAIGREIYAAHCAECHGSNLEGAPGWHEPLDDGSLRPPPHDVSGHTWHHPNKLLFDITKGGGQSQAPDGLASNMPGFAGILTDREIVAVLSYIQSHWPQDVLDQRDRYLEID